MNDIELEPSRVREAHRLVNPPDQPWANGPTVTISPGYWGAVRSADEPIAGDQCQASADEVLTGREAARLLKVPERTLADWRYQQKGPPYHRVGRHVRYLGDEVRAWLACQ